MTEEYIIYLTHLLRCAVTGEKADDMLLDIDAKEFFELCASHKVENIAYYALKETDVSNIPAEVWAQFEESYMRAVAIEAAQQYYLELIEAEFEKEGIDYLVLKGREIAKLYPSSDMRQSSDFDIYIGRENAKKGRDIMLRNGFEILAYGDDNDCHDEYVIDNRIMCELHRVLIQDDQPWQKECNKIPERLILRSGTKHNYEMNTEDFYLYNLAHTAKHMKLSGIGIKAFLDLWIIYNKYKASLNMEYLNKKLQLCSLVEFDKHARSLCRYWFEGEEPSELVKRMSAYVAESGWIGTVEQMLSGQLAEAAGESSSKLAAKVKKCVGIIMSPYEDMARRYPVLKKHKSLMPFCRIHRAFSAAVHKRELVRSITDELEQGDMEMGKRILRFKKEIGL